jgi:hypothetical protein
VKRFAERCKNLTGLTKPTDTAAPTLQRSEARQPSGDPGFSGYRFHRRGIATFVTNCPPVSVCY